jgi:hypothetical protein
MQMMHHNDADRVRLETALKAITLRDIPEGIAERIQQQAKINGTSLNRTVIDLLAKAVSAPQNRRCRHHDLDHLIGSWSEEEADQVNEVVEQQRVVDVEMWR